MFSVPCRVTSRFWAKVTKSNDVSECWTWNARKDKKGYGYFSVFGRGHSCQAAHRVSYALTYGPFPKELCVLHKCDNPSCVNPSHLFLGTVAENNADCKVKGRNNVGDRNGARTKPERVARGEKIKSSKLTAAQINAIKALSEAGYLQKEIAQHHGVTQSTVSRVLNGKVWAHVQ